MISYYQPKKKREKRKKEKEKNVIQGGKNPFNK